MRWTGTALTLLATGLVELAASRRDESLLDRAGRVVVDLAPLPLVEETVRVLGTTDKPALRGGLAGGVALAGGLLVDRLTDREAPPWLGPLAAVGAVAALATARGRLRARAAEAERHAPRIRVPDPLPRPTDGAEDWQGVEPLLTTRDRFYVTDVNLRPPVVDHTTWRLEVGERQYAFDDVVALGLRERHALLACVHNRLGWDRLGLQTWAGVPLVDVLVAGGVTLPDDPATVDVVMTAVDGYRQVLPLATAIEADSWVVVGMGGRALPVAQGFPARVMTPGVVGQYNGVKWLARLELAPHATVDATWVARGWPRETVWIRPMARIDRPARNGMPPRLPRGPVPVAAGPTSVVGTAWHPPHGVARVEVAVDGGAWQPAELAREVAPAAWRRWRLDVDLPPGRHTLAARCVSRDGTVQSGEPGQPFPYGTTGHHTVDVRAD